MLTAFTVENYRSFADRTRIELRPLTLLFGYNNSGKSALVRVLPLVADSMQPDITGPLNLDGEASRGAPFEQLMTRNSGSRSMRIGLELPGGMSVEYVLAQPAGSLFQEMVSATIAYPERGTMTFELVPRRGDVPEYAVRWEGKRTSIVWTQPFAGLALGPYRQITRDDDAEAARITQACDLLLESFSRATEPLRTRGLYWLGSLRRYPERNFTYRPGGSSPRLSYDGSMAQEILARDKLAQGPLLPEVSAWYEGTFRRRLDLTAREDNQWVLTLEPKEIGDAGRSPVPVPVADTGEGMAQVLPVLLAAAMARRGEARHGDPRLLAFEQPELHLHTAAHEPLARHLCALAARHDPPTMLVETHSENFLLGVQLAVAQKRLPRDRVLIYWVEQDHDGVSSAQPIELDEEGYANGFPDQVFDSDLDLSRLLIKAREDAAA